MCRKPATKNYTISITLILSIISMKNSHKSKEFFSTLPHYQGAPQPRQWGLKLRRIVIKASCAWNRKVQRAVVEYCGKEDSRGRQWTSKWGIQGIQSITVDPAGGDGPVKKEGGGVQFSVQSIVIGGYMLGLSFDKGWGWQFVNGDIHFYVTILWNHEQQSSGGRFKTHNGIRGLDRRVFP